MWFPAVSVCTILAPAASVSVLNVTNPVVSVEKKIWMFCSTVWLKRIEEPWLSKEESNVFLELKFFNLTWKEPLTFGS